MDSDHLYEGELNREINRTMGRVLVERTDPRSLMDTLTVTIDVMLTCGRLRLVVAAMSL